VLSVTASVCTSTVIAIDRYLVVARPLKRRASRRARLAAIWILASALSSVQLVVGRSNPAQVSYTHHLRQTYTWLSVILYSMELGTMKRDSNHANGVLCKTPDIINSSSLLPTNHSFSQKTRLNDLSYGIKIWTDFSFVLSQSTSLTDRQTDRILIARPRLHSSQRGNKNSLVSTLT